MEELRKWTAADEEAVYAEIGRFFVLFQTLESELFQICWLLSEEPNGAKERRKLADLRYGHLVSEAGRRSYAFLVARGKSESDFAQRFHGLLRECRRLADRRNGIAHSAYVFLESGDDTYGIIRADMTKGKEDAEFEYEAIEPSNIERDSRRIALTAFGLSQSRVQLIHWAGQAEPEAQSSWTTPTCKAPGKTAPAS